MCDVWVVRACVLCAAFCVACCVLCTVRVALCVCYVLRCVRCAIHHVRVCMFGMLCGCRLRVALCDVGARLPYMLCIVLLVVDHVWRVLCVAC